MYDRFRSRFRCTNRVHEDAGAAYVPELSEVDAFLSEFSGSTFDGGLYRVHTAAGAMRWTQHVMRAYPSLGGSVWAFAFDWLGRHFALSWEHRHGAELGVVMVEPGTGQVLDIPATFTQFHEVVLVDQTDAALAQAFFEEWRSTSEGRPLTETECVGYRVPLFLSGEDNVTNLMVTDAKGYLDLNGLLWQQVKDLNPGTKISGITIDGKRPVSRGEGR